MADKLKSAIRPPADWPSGLSPVDSRAALFDQREASAIGGCLGALKLRHPKLFKALREQYDALHVIARAISQYPPIIGEQRLGRSIRSTATLVRTLRGLDDTNREIHVPSKAVLGRGLIIAKVNYLAMLRRLAFDATGLRAFRRDLDDSFLKNVLMLMSEDVCIAPIEDGKCRDGLRSAAALRLADIWERRLDHEMAAHAPALLSLWKARRTVRSIYGTMMGVSELAQIAFHAEAEWSEFISARVRSGEAVQAMEEFLFGLSHEELTRLRRVMRKRALAAVDPRGVSAILGRGRTYSAVENRDPRRLYEFYRQRRAAAYHRTAADLPGPRITIEELLLRHLLEYQSSAAPEA